MAEDIALENGTIEKFEGKGSKYTFTVRPIREGLVRVQILKDKATNNAGTKNEASNTESVTYDITRPTVSLTSTATTTGNIGTSRTVTVTLTLTEDATVTLYNESLCSTSISAATQFGLGAGHSLTTDTLPLVSKTIIYGRAIDAAGNVSACTSLTSYLNIKRFEDPNPSTNNEFGGSVLELTNGNIVITSRYADVGGVTDSGAVYLYNGSTGLLINSLYGSTTNDFVGSTVTALTNGNFVVSLPDWDCTVSAGCGGNIANAGAVAWASGVNGIGGFVSVANSLVGSTSGDVGAYNVVPLTNGNYLVRNHSWDCLVSRGCSGTVANVGSVTWGSGISGVSGFISATNSLVGSTANDEIGRSDSVVALTNGNYVVGSSLWDCQAALGCAGTISNVGAVTWGSGAIGISGFVSTANSLVGSTAEDGIGSQSQIYPLSNGNYVIASSSWDCAVSLGCSGSISDVGAVTWASGTVAIIGVVNATNSLVGSTTADGVGAIVEVLTNGNYVVGSSQWDCQIALGCSGLVVNAGAATWASGLTGITGPVSFSNSLVGSTNDDFVALAGSSSRPIQALTNGNYVVRSTVWDCKASLGCSGATADVGAVTWGSGTSGITGAVSATNSLVGSSINDRVGQSLIALSNGNYVVGSVEWDCLSALGCSGTIANVGAATFGSGTTGATGLVSASNSLIGSSANDYVGFSVALANGNYVVVGSFWDCKIALGCTSDVSNVGSVTWASGTTGLVGVVTATNSLVGSSSGDSVGMGAEVNIEPLNNGNYVVGSEFWDCLISLGCASNLSDVGAITWGSGVSGVTGEISPSNSFVGSSAGDLLGNADYGTVFWELSNSNYVFGSNNVDCPTSIGCATSLIDSGALTWGSGLSGVTGFINTSNSLMNATDGALFGGNNATPLSNGNFIISNLGTVFETTGLASINGIL
ncbi:MAG: hypothetical protein NT027_09350 [Proteobacteria bacterium]|nr:hypothetical protein [Pseudomonadota bacterium]